MTSPPVSAVADKSVVAAAVFAAASEAVAVVVAAAAAAAVGVDAVEAPLVAAAQLVLEAGSGLGWSVVAAAAGLADDDDEPAAEGVASLQDFRKRDLH